VDQRSAAEGDPLTPAPASAAVYEDLWQSVVGADRDSGPWRAVEYRFSLDDALDLSVSRSFYLDSQILEKSGVLRSEIEVIPLPRIESHTWPALVEVVSITGRRTTVPVHPQSLKKLVEHAGAAEGEYIGIPLTLEESRSSPIVSVTTSSTTRHPLDSKLRARQLQPVSSFYAPFEYKSTVPALRVSLPEYAETDVAAIVCQLDWSRDAERLQLAALDIESLPDLSAQGRAELLSGKVSTAFRKAQDDIEKSISLARDSASAAISQVEGDGYKPPDSWTVELLASDRLLRHWSAKWPAPGPNDAQDFNDVLESASQLCDVLRYLAPRFVLIVAIQRITGLACFVESRTAFPDGLRKSTRLLSVRVPFTTEREPGTLGKRSSVVLFGLGALLGLTALVDLSWLGIGESKDAGSDPLRDPLVALLLIFPAALYGQFFQSRPRSAIGIRAQLGTFAILSLLFALPIGPALAAAIGLPLWFVSLICAVLAVFASVAGWWVWRVFSNDRLRELRVNEVTGSEEVAGVGKPRIFNSAQGV